MTLTQARKQGAGHPSAAIVAAHRALIENYIRNGRHLDRNGVKSFACIGRDLGGLLSRKTLRTTMRKFHPEIARQITERHTSLPKFA